MSKGGTNTDSLHDKIDVYPNVTVLRRPYLGDKVVTIQTYGQSTNFSEDQARGILRALIKLYPLDALGSV